VVPKFLAMAVMMPCLAIWSDLMGVLGGCLFGVIGGNFTFGSYVIATRDAMVFTISPAASSRAWSSGW
jgi:phospholipid/cholesterol/gamma-HCH transport system permease protein